jgi:hypothetical protein
MNGKRKSTKTKKYRNLRLDNLELPYSHGLLTRFKLIPVSTSAIEVMRLTQRLIKVPAIAKQRTMGVPVQTILERMSERSLALLRKKL